jgi:hypothetical protein
VRYENLLTRSFRILRRNLWLWPLALLAGLTSFGGNGGGGGSYTISRPGAAPPDFSWLPQWFADRVGLFAEIGIAVLVVALAWFLISCVASGALVGAVARIDAGEAIGFGAAWRIGTAAFGRVLLFKLLVFVLLVVPAFLIVIPILVGALGGSRGAFAGLLLSIPLAIAYVYWAAFIGWLAELGLRACVLGQLTPVASLREAFALLQRRFHRVALTTVVFIAVGIGIGILTQVIFSFIQAPFTATVAADVVQGRWSDAVQAGVIWAGILIPVSLAVSSAVGAYFAIAWTLAYRRFDVEGEVAEPPLPAP